MQALHTETIEKNNKTYRIVINYDDCSAEENPLKEWCGMGSILSQGCRHRNYDPDGVKDALKNNTDVVPLSYYEHGNCVWSVKGEGPLCLWNYAPLAGIWVPDEEILKEARNYGGRTRQLFMKKRAREVCKTYTQWCNGEIYEYKIEEVYTCDACGQEHIEFVDSCGGIYGLDYCINQAKSYVEGL